MKKLSFIMAVLMILMCMPIMAISAAEEVVAPVASMDILKTDGKAYSFAGAYATGFTSDEEANASGVHYYWRIGEEGSSAYYFQYMQDAAAVALKKGNSNVVYMIDSYRANDQKGNDVGRGQSMKIEQDLIIDGQGNELECAFGGKWSYRFESTEGDLKINHAFTIKNMTIECSQSNSFFQVRGKVIFENVNYVSYTTNALGAFLMQSPTNMTFYNSEFKTTTSSNGNANGAAFRFNELNASRGDSVVNIYNSNFELANSMVMCQADGSATSRAVVNFYSGTITAKGCNTNDASVKRDAFAFTKKYYQLNVYGGSIVTDGMLVNANDAGANFGVNIYGGNITVGKDKTAIQGGVKNSTVNIAGGTIMLDGGKLTSITGADKNQTFNVSGGTIIGRNFNVYGINDFNGTAPLSGLIYSSANTKNINITGGTFTIYSDHGATLADKGAIIYAWGSAADLVNVSGGNFNGGEAFLVRGAYSNNEQNPFDADKSKVYNHTYGNSTSFSPIAKEGASVRLNKDNSGLRFTSVMSGVALKYIEENLKLEGTDIELGTIIVPSNYVKYAGGELTHEALLASGKAFLDVKAENGKVVDDNGNITINAALVNIKKENYSRDFVAVSYIKYTNKLGEEVVKYAGNVSLSSSSRNVEEVAAAALADVLTTAAGTYTNKVDGYYVWNQNARKYELTPGVAYSRYNAEQLAVLKSYIIAE